MKAIPVIAIFDIGKTNKKFFLLNEAYKIVLERSVQFEETKDEDGDACEDVQGLRAWVQQTLKDVLLLKKFAVKAVNFSTYGASFVYINKAGEVVAPLYNYLKSYPAVLKEQFYTTYGDAEAISRATASPVLESLNSGMQLYRLKHTQPAVYKKVQYALHLPQYISYLVTGKAYSDITSIGCHTQLWDFEQKDYHQWVKQEGLEAKLAPLFSSNEAFETTVNDHALVAGIGLHDSSAALIPYLASFSEPFVLISTGTWCISLNPFNHEPLTAEELANDCLCYMEYHGNPVKAARLFAGYEHEQQTKRLSAHFGKPANHFAQVAFNIDLLQIQEPEDDVTGLPKMGLHTSGFANRNLDEFDSYEAAYHQLMYDIIQQQYASTSLILTDSVTRIFVDGGFSKNAVYMNLLAMVFPKKEIFAASVSQATAIGAALAIHKYWNSKAVPGDMIDLKFYTAAEKIEL